MFVAIYAVVVLFGVAALMYAAAQWILGQDPWALWGVPGAVVLWLIVYLSAFYGQGLGRDQMYELRSFVEAAATSSGWTRRPTRPSAPDGIA